MTSRSKLTHISISGFKSFGSNENSLDLDLKDVNIIIGTNGAGKSSFISFFKMLNHITTEALQLYIDLPVYFQNLCFDTLLNQKMH